jgi:alpha-1,2-mannosyltransferase
VWAAPALLLLAVRGLQGKSRALLAAALAGLVVLAAGPQWWFPHTENREAYWAAWEQVIGGSYVILAAVILLISACRNPVARQR